MLYSKILLSSATANQLIEFSINGDTHDVGIFLQGVAETL